MHTSHLMETAQCRCVVCSGKQLECSPWPSRAALSLSEIPLDLLLPLSLPVLPRAVSHPQEPVGCVPKLTAHPFHLIC